MTTRERAHELVDQLSEEVLKDALDYLEWLASDEPETLTPEEWAEVEESKAEMARGEFITLDGLKRELGL
jgi:hypothetical protein